jgi:hypothetical protein
MAEALHFSRLSSIYPWSSTTSTSPDNDHTHPLGRDPDHSQLETNFVRLLAA